MDEKRGERRRTVTKEQATAEATKIAKSEGQTMVVTYNPYDEEPDEAKRYGYFPKAAFKFFPHEEIVETIEA